MLHVRSEHLLNKASTDAAYLRGRAGQYRRHAGGARDSVIHEELLRLADTYERMADNAEIEQQAGIALGC
jgi:hypothetical protein